MRCPQCDYMMDAFDKECPRCHGKGLSKPEPEIHPDLSKPLTRNAPLSHTKVQPVAQVREQRCMNCSTPILAGQKFCPSCGAEVGTGQPGSLQHTVSPATATSHQGAYSGVPPIPSPHPPTAPHDGSHAQATAQPPGCLVCLGAMVACGFLIFAMAFIDALVGTTPLLTWGSVIASSIGVYYDAKSLGVRRGLMPGSMFDMNPAGWAWGCGLLWIIVFPAYLATRPSYEKIKG